MKSANIYSTLIVAGWEEEIRKQHSPIMKRTAQKTGDGMMAELLRKRAELMQVSCLMGLLPRSAMLLRGAGLPFGEDLPTLSPLPADSLARRRDTM